jgi:acetone carboxylase gamma subunit
MSDVTLPNDAQTGDALERRGSIGGAFSFVRDDAGDLYVGCAECGHRYGPPERDPKLAARMSERTILDLSTLNESVLADRLVARHFYCPSCGLLFAINVQQHGDPIMLEWSIDSATLPATA